MFDETSSEPIKELPWFVAQRIVGDYMLFCPGRRAASFLTKLFLLSSLSSLLPVV